MTHRQETFKDLQALPEIASFRKADWENLTEKDFERIFRQSPLWRAGFASLKKNIRFLKNNE